MANSPTVGLAVIVAEYNKELEDRLKPLEPHVDKFFIQVNGSKAPEKSGLKNVEFSEFKWVDDFAKARNALHKNITTDFWVWADDDDVIRGAENWRKMASDMRESGVDVFSFVYHYDIDPVTKETIALQWRERLVDSRVKGEWKGRLHETFIPESEVTQMRSPGSAFFHIKTEKEKIASRERNHRILLELCSVKKPDPRDLHYLGISHFGRREWNEAIKCFLEHIKRSGWDEESYRSWLKIGEIHCVTEKYDRAVDAAMEALKLLPNYPMAYFLLEQIYFEWQKYGFALYWFEMGKDKPMPETNSVYDPTAITYRKDLVAALCYTYLGNPREGFKLVKKVGEEAPQYDAYLKYGPEIRDAALEDVALEQATEVIKYLQATQQGNPEQLLESLGAQLRTDVRLAPVRKAVIKPKEWGDKSIVFYCGRSGETWGPDTMDKGMGGSEEAVTYLSRELAKLGWEVTVYNERDDELESNGVVFKPWHTFNEFDKFNVFVAWRNPSLLRTIDAKLKCVDMHDTPIGHQEITKSALEHIDKVFFKSVFQREMAPHVPDEKVVIIPNGIVLEQFDQKVERNSKKVIFGSSADRGLNYLLDVWEDVKKEVPDAELYWWYGWNVYDQFHKNNPELMKWKLDMIRRMYDLKVKGGTRISHEELAKEFLSSGVWAYPTQFPEIDCITAKKAQLAGCTPITSGYAALQTSVLDKEDDWGGNVTDENKKEFTKRLVKALKEPETEEQRDKRAQWVKDNFGWRTVAKSWSDTCESAS